MRTDVSSRIAGEGLLKNVTSLPSYLPTILSSKRAAFTLPEVLITLGIIGVVAAITLPTLIQNYKKQAYVTQLKKTVSSLENAFKLAMAEDGVDDLGDTQLFRSIPAAGGQINPGNIKGSEFVNQLGKYIKIIDVKDGSYQPKIKLLNKNGTTTAQGAIFFADGSRLLAPFFINRGRGEAIDQIKDNGGHLYYYYSFPLGGGPFNFFDVNGEKGPNQIGRDIFFFVIGQDGKLYPSYGKDFAINWYSGENYKSHDMYWNKNGTMKYCSTAKQAYGEGCAARIIEEGWQMNY